MKKIFTLLAVVMASLPAMAQTTFYGTWKNNANSFPSFDNYVETDIASLWATRPLSTSPKAIWAV